MPKPLPQEALEFDVDAIDAQGWGVGDVGGQGVRVKGVLAGERVRAQARRREGRALVAELQAVLRADPARVEPACAHFFVCGGCTWQHLDSDTRIRRNEAEVAERLRDAGIDAPAPLPVVRGPLYNYRRRARMSARFTQRGERMFVGFREGASRQIADIARCEILVEPFASALTPLRHTLEASSVRHAVPQLELAAGDDAAAVVIRHMEGFTAADLRLLRAWQSEWNIAVWGQAGGPATARPLFDDADARGERLHYQVHEGAPRMAFHPLDFVQVNAEVNRALVGLALEELRVAGARKVLDLFCGIGNFTLPIAQQADSVVGIESVPELVQRGQENAAANGLRNARFMALDLHGAGVGRLAELGTFDAVLLDPPRTGVGASREVLARLGAPLLIYVSCNPATFATDLQALAADGYRLRRWRVLDMFPHTRHVECMGVLEREAVS